MTTLENESDVHGGDEAHAIEARSVVKRFGRTLALDRLDLRVRRGEVHAFLGPNGAGKTTTLRLLLGLLRGDGGTVRVLSLDPWTDASVLHRRLAYVPGEVSLWPNLTGGEVIDLLVRLRGRPDDKRRAALIRRFDLDPTKQTRSYSKGNRQKVALIAALTSEVDLYLLDEPTSGLDPLMEAAFRESIVELRRAGKTVLLSSHILSEAEALADRVSIIRSGQVVESGSLSELRHLTRSTVDADVESVPPDLASLPGVHDLRVDGKHVSAAVDQTGLGRFVSALAAAGLCALTCQPPTLEELFLRHYAEHVS